MTRAVKLLLAVCLAAALASCSPGQTPNQPLVGAPVAGIDALPPPAGMQPSDWEELKDELARVLAEYKAASAVPKPPGDNNSKVSDLQVSGSVGGSATFRWSYRCSGDYDQNGEVNISDLTPIGANFGKTSADANWKAATVADGDRNGEINIADVTPIGARFSSGVSGYELQTAPAEDGAWTALADISLGTSQRPAGGGFFEFSFTTDAEPVDAFYRVVPFLGSGESKQLGVPSLAVCLEAAQLGTPANFAASNFYADRISMSWGKVSSATGYLVYRDDSATPLATLGDVSAYDDTAVVDSVPHTYWVRATDGTRTSNYSLPAIGQRAAVPPALAPPANVQAGDGASGSGIDLTWDKSAGATGYEVYRDHKVAPLAILGDVAAYSDTSLADGSVHTYWLVALGGGDRSAFSLGDSGYRSSAPTGDMVVLGYGEIGMTFLQPDASELLFFPPGSTLRATVIDRSGTEPRIVTSGVSVRYSFPGNSYSAGKVNFWDFEDKLFGASLQPNLGLTGHGLWGELAASVGAASDWEVSAVPLTPFMDDGAYNPYPLASIAVFEGGVETAATQAVLAVSTEVSCAQCHVGTIYTSADDILTKHDAMHGTVLKSMKPVQCGMCHAQPELGKNGLSGYPSLSAAIHGSHASRVGSLGLEQDCFACHPGQTDKYQRDVHYSAGLGCADCHGTVAQMGAAGRKPWVDEPRCDSCHTRAGFTFEQPGKLYKDSQGHNGVQCAACHGSPHAIYPSVVDADNLQSLAIQGHPGRIDTCTVCHSSQPGDAFAHTYTPPED